MDDQDTQHIDTDVLIIGAGPIGLTTACALAHHGVRFRIIEKAHGISGASKGHNVIARAQELLGSIGVLDPISDKSYRAPFTQFFLDQVPFARLDARGSDSPYEGVLFSNQGVIEQVLTDILAGRGIAVEYGREATAIKQSDDGVSVEVAPVDEDGIRVGGHVFYNCRYLVGCDGAPGTARKAAGLDYEVKEFEGRALRQMDGTLHWRRSTEPHTARFFLFPHGFAGVLPVWEGGHRLFVLEQSEKMPDRKPTREEMVTRAREVTGDQSFDLTDPTWSSYGTFSHGVAPAYAKGRIFLAGDAGHRTLPIGGQGMNAGFLDAVSIAWRLAMTLSGAAGPLILESYGPERHGAHEALGKQQVRGFEQLMHRNKLADGLIGTIAGLVPSIGSYVFGGSDLEQLTVGYPDSFISEDHFSAFNPKRAGALRAGDRAPYAELTDSAGHDVSLFDMFYGNRLSWGWRLLLLDGGDQASHPLLWEAAGTASGVDWISPTIVVADPDACGHHGAETVFDLDGLVHEAFGLAGQSAVVLVRPDGHIAFRCPAKSYTLLAAYLAKISGNPTVAQ
ncbi:FAD-dependent monooxygenase [Rhizobium sp. CC-YZS058]|uniref:FAD-dependent monooxygenase n=1 Tax=Rhizobium sp. CC-YZS058 TaxID=3042153 RepID=UPI002B057411|nr:FAD-dependent monooxygenase [Rhizobium sp. CC-YZS058]MEA3536995.1 FAD-dependent monooxygenase [Rhizobium sp. CC-YZS058]